MAHKMESLQKLRFFLTQGFHDSTCVKFIEEKQRAVMVPVPPASVTVPGLKLEHLLQERNNA